MISTRLAARDVDVSRLQSAEFLVTDKREQVIEEKPPLPYTTASLLEDATRQGFVSDEVMRLAQSLYESGLITYPRTDATRVAIEASLEGRAIAERVFGAGALARPAGQDDAPAGGAHEAIRPTYAARLPGELGPDVSPEAQRIYNLIWGRFIAGFLRPARVRVVTVELEVDA